MINTFLSYDDYNYIINIISSKNFSYKFLNNMFNKILKILKNYFNENLAFDKIKYLIVNIYSFILFISKNNNNLKLYIDYKNLNIVFF